jgi:hypothetical protein
MALTTDNLAAMVFERFIELVMPPGELRKSYTSPATTTTLWESARERYVNFVSKISRVALWIFCTTNIFLENETDPIPLYFPTRLVQRYPTSRASSLRPSPHLWVLSKDGTGASSSTTANSSNRFNAHEQRHA